MTWRSRAAAATLLLAAACTQLPSIGSGECGNGVVEPPEDCDSFGAESGASCRPKGAVGECHLDCSRAAGGRSLCPEGWGCDLGGICRRPTGELEQRADYEVGTATQLFNADFDGDGRADLMSTEPADSFGVTRIKFHYFDEQGNLTDTRSFPRLLISPDIASMNGDALPDVVFTDSRVGVLPGRADRSWVPETFSSYRIEGSLIRTITLRDDQIENTSGFVVLSALATDPGVYIPDALNNGFPRLLGPLPGPVDRLVGDPAAAQLIEGDAAPCKQLVVAMRDESAFWVYDACSRADDGSIRWRSPLGVQLVPLDPPVAISSGPQVADINSDGHLDVFIGGGERMYVAYGDGQTLAPAVPYELSAANRDEIEFPPAGMPMPLAAADVTGDGVIDFVMTAGALLSSPGPQPGGPPSYRRENGGQPRWTSALIADFNGNGKLDIVAGSSERPGIDFYNGTGTPSPTFFAIPTSRPVQHLVSGDFDGDLLEDLAFTQPNAAEDGENTVMIAFGAPFGPPLPPAPVARVRAVEQMSTFREFMLSHLLISSSESTDLGPRGVLTLLTGSGDRIPVALYELSTFAADSSVNGSQAARVVAGSFLGNDQPGDVLAIGFDSFPFVNGLEFWLLPALATTAGTPVLLEGTFPVEAVPAPEDGSRLSLAAISADLDGDGRDEALFAMPAQDDEHCELFIFSIEPERAVLQSSTLLAEPCARVELASEDVDLDQHPDVLWLTGQADGSQRTLSVLWNDGAGGFAADRRSIVAGPELSPQAFALVPGQALLLATSSGVQRVPLLGGLELGEATELLSLPDCTGVTTADVNGDGVLDLVAAARGNLTVLEAALEAL